MFHDSVFTIVPKVDQKSVEKRKHIEDVLTMDSSSFGYYDPTYKYSEWYSRKNIQKVLFELAKEIRHVIVNEENMDLINIDLNGVPNSNQEKK